MGFTIRDANINDAIDLFEMIETYHKEVIVKHKNFTNTKDKFITEAFEDKSAVKFFIAEYQGNILGYGAYVFSYNIIKGLSLVVKEIYIKKEYRNLGVSVFMFSKIIDLAFNNNCTLINWNINLNDKRIVEIEEKVGVIIDRDMLILNIRRKDIEFYVKSIKSNNNNYEIRFPKTYELPDVFECISNLANYSKKDLKIDIYKLMQDVFSSKPKVKILVALKDDLVIGFMSFYKSYCTSSGEILEVDQIFIKKEYRNNGIGQQLLNGLFTFAYDNNYTKVETYISKFEVEKIESLKEYNIYPYPNLRLAHYVKEEFIKLYSSNEDK